MTGHPQLGERWRDTDGHLYGCVTWPPFGDRHLAPIGGKGNGLPLMHWAEAVKAGWTKAEDE